MLGSRDMNEFNSDWWTVRLPDDWITEHDDTCASMFAESRVGALQICAARNSNGPATDDDIRDFAKEHLDAGALIKPVTCGSFTGFCL